MFGKTAGLNSNQEKNLLKLYRRKIPVRKIITWEIAKQLCTLSKTLDRNIGIMVDRSGYVQSVAVGTNFDIDFPFLTRLRATSTRLSGYRLIYTKLNKKGLSKKEKNMLYDRRLDAIGSIEVQANGAPGKFDFGHLQPEPSGFDTIVTDQYSSVLDIDIPFDEWVIALEDEFQKIIQAAYIIEEQSKAILCYLITPQNKATIVDEIDETIELARTVGLKIVKIIFQQRPQPDPKYFYGKGKTKDLVQEVISQNADMILFHQNLTPNQFRILGDHLDIPIIDRTQLILDIFAQRAKSHEGKLQVELAQLQYTLPRLREKNTQMSRLVGGIGGRGPGETKLEIHRRRANQKISKLQKELEKIKSNRMLKRQARNRKNLPIVSIVGYTNAGKSTLLNALTQSHALAEDKLFATLDPFSKRLRFPKDQEIILTDTVGFIRDLPPPLIEAFQATLEEIQDASIIIHLIDVSNEQCEKHIEVVDQLLKKLGLDSIEQIKVFNKIELADPEQAQELIKQYEGIGISAMDRKTLRPLLTQLEDQLFTLTA